ncbi:MAG: hypothetical protein VR73_09265 [Gammaproteobacteria bacterium BRH_c0]|nr:MAG: hypothetical protein VR73_09265 [Gammaproteobacteria bacterium BRH_c0]
MDSALNPSSRTAPVIRALLAWAACVLTTYVLASLMQTGFVLTALHSAGAQLPPGIILRTVLHDLYGLAFNALFVSYLLLIVIGFVIALPVAALLKKWTHARALVIYPLAGAVLMGSMLGLAKMAFYGLSLYAGTRGPAGLACQMLAGAAGGLVFALINREKSR